MGESPRRLPRHLRLIRDLGREVRVEESRPAAPTIQVFDVDVQKVVASTPLIQAFDKPLPSAQKIQATVEVQQAKMSEGKWSRWGLKLWR